MKLIYTQPSRHHQIASTYSAKFIHVTHQVEIGTRPCPYSCPRRIQLHAGCKKLHALQVLVLEYGTESEMVVWRATKAFWVVGFIRLWTMIGAGVICGCASKCF
jgi:hypothetical protein